MSFSLSAEDIENARKRKALRLQEEPPQLGSGSTSVTNMTSGSDNSAAKRPRRQTGGSSSSDNPSSAAANSPGKPAKAPTQASQQNAQSASSTAPQFLFNEEHSAAIMAMPATSLKQLAKKLGLSVANPTATNVKVAILRYTGTAAHVIFDKAKASFTFTGLQKQDFSQPAAPAQA